MLDGVLSVLEELKVKKVYISKQIEKSEKYNEFLNITNQKNIEVHEVVAGNRIHIEKNLYFDVLWPDHEQITRNALNNNSVVFNLYYKNFSMLFTGDIEEIAENEILNLYSSNKNIFKLRGGDSMYRCLACGYEYNPEIGDPDNGIAPGTAFEDLPDTWVCPLCGVGKDMFEEV